jgi:hypothetical protein
LIGVAVIAALLATLVSAHEISLPAAPTPLGPPASLAHGPLRVSSEVVGESRVTCPGPEQSRAHQDWFVKPVRENAAALLLLPTAEGPAGASKSEADRLKPVVIKIPAVEFPRPAIVPDIKPSWQPQTPDDAGFQWGAALRQSFRFLVIQHAFRLATENGTRADLKGPFFKDYWATLKSLRGWRDGDPFMVNYIGHPMMGAVTGYIQVQNDPRGRKQEVGFNKEYFKSRLKAFGWSALYSTQFELGPISEASLGNVGIRPTNLSRHPMGYVDLVVTPVIGTAWLMGEDALDKHVVLPLESRVHNKTVRLLIRSFLNPSRSMANVLRSKWPWYRDDRKL